MVRQINLWLNKISIAVFIAVEKSAGEENTNKFSAATAAKSLQSCPTLCDPIDGSLPGSPVPGILQTSTGVGCHFLLQCVKVKLSSRVRLLATLWTAAYQAPPSMGFSRQEYWSGVPLPSLNKFSSS